MNSRGSASFQPILAAADLAARAEALVAGEPPEEVGHPVVTEHLQGRHRIGALAPHRRHSGAVERRQARVSEGHLGGAAVPADGEQHLRLQGRVVQRIAGRAGALAPTNLVAHWKWIWACMARR